MGGDIGRSTRDGIRRTHFQKTCEVSSAEIVKYMLVFHADPNKPPAQGRGYTALQLAAINSGVKIAQLLLDYGADIHGPPVKVPGRIAFECAAENGRLHMLPLLWETAAPWGYSRTEIQTARRYAMAEGHRGCATYIEVLSKETTR